MFEGELRRGTEATMAGFMSGPLYFSSVITDPPPSAVALRKQYAASDAQTTMELPDAAALQAAASALRAALETGERVPVKKAGVALLAILATHYGVEPPGLSVLGSRPHTVIEGQYSWELFGDYTPATRKIRVWMRTAVLGKVTSYKGLLNTLLHEFCHHLDVHRLGYSDSPHTRGFFGRIDGLYHLALNTPAEKRKPLVWIRSGKGWRVDWRKLR
jgi:hypothetical protein